MRRPSFAGALMLLVAVSVPAAEEHHVILQNDSFSPQHLTIAAGDSVRWTNEGSHPHNVAADDGSFRCAEGCDSADGPGTDSYHGGDGSPGDPSAANWSFVRTFNQTGEIGYHCETHGSPGVGMFGTLTVEAAEVEPVFTINPGMIGSWFNPDTSGQGFLFDFVTSSSPKLMVAYWFTYALDSGEEENSLETGPSGQRWMFAEGTMEDNSDSVVLDVYLVTGGAFDQPEPEVSLQLIGMAEATFQSCTEGEFSYSLDFDGDEENQVSGTFPLLALSPDIEERCLSHSEAQE